MPRRANRWATAFVLALAAHLGILYLSFTVPVMAPALRGGGLLEQGGTSAHSTGGLLVALSAPEVAPRAAPVPPSPPPAPAEPEALPEPEPEPEPEAEDVPEEEPEPAEVAPEEPAPVEPEVTQAASEATIESAPPEVVAAKPELKPNLPPRRTQVARREPPRPQLPKPQPQAQPTVPQVSLPAGALAVQPSRLGTAGGRQGGAIPKNLNYRDRVLLWLKRNIYYPSEAYEFRQEGVVLVRFAINRRGQILYYNIDKSSGFHLLDQAVRIMMAQSSPVPPFPAGETGNEMRFLVPVIFSRKLTQ